MLLYTINYLEDEYEIVAHNFEEMYQVLENYKRTVIIRNEVVLRSVVQFSRIKQI